MAILQGHLTWRGNALCFAHSAENYQYPIRTMNLWELEQWPAPGPDPETREDFEGQETNSVQAPHGGWEVTIKCGYSRRFVTIPGNRKPRETVNDPVPEPKVRKGIKTKWEFGRWHKLLKTGWVTA